MLYNVYKRCKEENWAFAKKKQIPDLQAVLTLPWVVGWYRQDNGAYVVLTKDGVELMFEEG